MKVLLALFATLALIAGPALAGDMKQNPAASPHQLGDKATGQDVDKAPGQASPPADEGQKVPAAQDPKMPAAQDDKAKDLGQASPSAQVGPTSERPLSKDDCKKGGWSRFTDPAFKNQGQCVRWVNRQERENRK